MVYNGLMPVELPRVQLKKGEEKRLQQGELWAYDNEIQTDLSGIRPGELCYLFSNAGEYIATGYVNANSVITFRLLSRQQDEIIDREYLKRRISQADQQRRSIQPENVYYRLVFGEADFLPGLVIDRFDDYFIIQISTAGMELFRDDIFDIIAELYPHGVLVEKSIGTARAKEGLEPIHRLVSANCSGEKLLAINGLHFQVDFLKSQKTGFFLDQRENYLLLRHISRGMEVLDAFSYAGAWGLHAYFFGARRVEFLEISKEYIQQTRENVARNGFAAEDFTFICDDAVQVLKQLSLRQEKKDIIVLDPPAFVKTRHKVREGRRGYKEINLRALKMLKPGGHLITCSCSHFLEREDFLNTVQQAAVDAGRQIKLLEFRSQPYDHGVLYPLYQSNYLKCAFFYVY